MQVRFIVMNNVFQGALPIGKQYDLKGSTLGRTSGADAAKTGTVLKDLDLDMKLKLEEGWHDRCVCSGRMPRHNPCESNGIEFYHKFSPTMHHSSKGMTPVLTVALRFQQKRNCAEQQCPKYSSKTLHLAKIGVLLTVSHATRRGVCELMCFEHCRYGL